MKALICAPGPEHLLLDGRTAAEHGQSLREFGEDIAKQYDTIKDRLTAPTLTAALNLLRDLEDLPDQLILAVTDSSPHSRFRPDNTVTIGNVLGRLMSDRYQIAKKPRSFQIRKTPSSVDSWVRELSRGFQEWESQYTRLYFLAAGSTSAASTAMFLAALSECPDKVTPVDVTQDVDSGIYAHPLAVIRRIQAAQRRRDLMAAIEYGRFSAAVALTPAQEEDLAIEGWAHRTTRAVAASADQRLRFELAHARTTLSHALGESDLPGSLYRKVVQLRESLPDPKDDAALLRELYHNAAYKLRYEEYADFVLRLFNFHQAALRQMAQHCGVEFERKGEFLTQSWLEQHPDFAAHAAKSCPGPDKGTSLHISSRRATGPVLMCLLAFLCNQRQLPRSILPQAECIQRVASLRNRCFAAHDFGPVTWEQIEECTGGNRRTLLNAMWLLCATASGHDVGPDPFAATVELCTELLQSAT